MADPQIPEQLPHSLHRFFWDVDAAKLNPGEKQEYVINRLLEQGDVEAVRWVLKNFQRNSIIETLKNRLDFSPKTALFWGRYLGIPREELKCMQEPYYSLHKRHWQP